MTQRSREEVIGDNWFKLFIPEKKQEQIKEIHSNICTEGISDFLGYVENEILTKSGKRIMIGWTNIPLKDLNGKICGTCSIGKEIISLSQISGLITGSSFFNTSYKKEVETSEGLIKVGDYCFYDSEPNDRVKVGLNMVIFQKNYFKIKFIFFTVYKRQSGY